MRNTQIIAINGIESLQQHVGQFAEVNRTPIYHQQGDTFTQIQDFDALLNARDGHCASVVSGRYGIVSHNVVIRSIARIAVEMNLPIKGIIKDESDSISASIYFDNVLIPDDAKGIKLGFKLTNSYDRSLTLKIDTFGYRLVCSNGMVVSKVIQNGCVSIKKHLGVITEGDVEVFLRSYFAAVISCTDTLRQKVEESQLVTLSFDTVTKMIQRKFKAEKHIQGVCDLLKIEFAVVEEENTKKYLFVPQNRTISVWELYNAVTAYATHNKHSIGGEEKIQDIAQEILLER